MLRICVGACNSKPGTQASTPAPLPRSHFPGLFAFQTPLDIGGVNGPHGGVHILEQRN